MAVIEQIYIDGQLFEQSEEGNMELVFQSPLFTDLDSIVSNRTNEVIFPLTAHNRRAMNLAGIVSPESSELYEYRKHAASYWRDGVHIFDGSATLLSWTATEVSFVFTWGNSEAFGKLFDTKLSALQDFNMAVPPRYLPYGFTGAPNAQYYPANISFGVGTIAGAPQQQYIHPSMEVEKILQSIESYTGVSGLSGKFGDWIVPLLTKKTTPTINIMQAPKIIQGAVHRTSLPHAVYLALGANDTDYIGMVNNGWIFDVGEFNTLTFTINGTLGYRLTIPSAEESATFSGNIRILATDEDGNNGVLLATIPTIANSWTDGTNYGQEFTVSNVNMDIDVSDYAYVVFLIASSSAEELTQGYSVAIERANINIVPDMNEPQEVLYLGNSSIANFPTYANLPDWSMGQFIKNLMKLSGLFANVKSGTEVELVSIGDVYDRRWQAYDWTKRLLGAVQTISPTFEDYAQRNTLKFAEDNSVNGSYNGVLQVDNTTLDAEKELMSVDFAATDTEEGNILNVPIYSYGGEGGAEVEYNGNVTPRILQRQQNNTVFTAAFNLSFARLVETVYADYQRTILRPRVITVDVYIEARELATLDLATPCYFEQLGHYYAILNLTTKEGHRATATLLQLTDQ